MSRPDAETLCFSIYSDISTRIIACSSAKHDLRKRLGKLCLSDAGRPQKQKGSDRTCRILQPGTAAPDGLCHGLHGLLLPDHTLVQLSIQMQEDVLRLLLCQALHRNLRPDGYDRLRCPRCDTIRVRLSLLQVHPLLAADPAFLPAASFLLIQHLRILISVLPGSPCSRSASSLLSTPPAASRLLGTRMEIAKLMADARLVDQIDRLVRQKPVIDVTHQKASLPPPAPHLGIVTPWCFS